MPITPIDLTLRNVKGSAVTATENDANLTNLKTASEELDANKMETEAYTKAVGTITNPLLDVPFNNNTIAKQGVAPTTDVTHTRATTGTILNRYNTKESLAINTPRFNEKGFLHEGERTNLLLASNDIQNVTYNWLDRSSAFTVTANSTDINSPDGTTNSAKFVATATPSSLFARQSALTLTNATDYAPSVWVYVPTQAGVSNWQILNNYNDSDASVAPVSTIFDEWVRVETTSLLTGARTGVDFVLNFNGTTPLVGYSFYTYETQLEEGEFATSNMPTTTAAVTRSTDDVEIVQENNIPNNFDSVTVLVDFSTLSTDITQRLFNLSVVGDINYFYIRVSAGGSMRIRHGSVDIIDGVIASNTKYRVGLRYKSETNILSLFIDGLLIASVDAGIQKANDFARDIELGSVSALEPYFGYWNNLRVIPEALSDDKMRIA